MLPGETSTDTALAGGDVVTCHDVTMSRGVTVSRPCHDTVRHNKPLLGTMPHIYISRYLGGDQLTKVSR